MAAHLTPGRSSDCEGGAWSGTWAGAARAHRVGAAAGCTPPKRACEKKQMPSKSRSAQFFSFPHHARAPAPPALTRALPAQRACVSVHAHTDPSHSLPSNPREAPAMKRQRDKADADVHADVSGRPTATAAAPRPAPPPPAEPSTSGGVREDGGAAGLPVAAKASRPAPAGLPAAPPLPAPPSIPGLELPTGWLQCPKMGRSLKELGPAFNIIPMKVCKERAQGDMRAQGIVARSVRPPRTSQHPHPSFPSTLPPRPRSAPSLTGSSRRPPASRPPPSPTCWPPRAAPSAWSST
jgi:hypothetical protein